MSQKYCLQPHRQEGLKISNLCFSSETSHCCCCFYFHHHGCSGGGNDGGSGGSGGGRDGVYGCGFVGIGGVNIHLHET